MTWIQRILTAWCKHFLSPRRSHLQRRVLESRCFGSMQENLKSVEHRNSLEWGLRFFVPEIRKEWGRWPFFALNGPVMSNYHLRNASPMGRRWLQSGCWARYRVWNLRSRIGWVNDVNIIWNEKKQDNGRWDLMPCFSVYSERTVIYFCFRLFGLSGIVILSWPLASRGFKYFLVK